MLNVLHKKDIKKLIAKYKGPCVSIFMPTHRGGAESQQDQVRFKNLFREAEQTLLKIGFRSQHLKDFLEPAQKILKDAVFWQKQIDGLSVFLEQESDGCPVWRGVLEGKSLESGTFPESQARPGLQGRRCLL